MNDNETTKTFATEKKIKKIYVDGNFETADIDFSNNVCPKEETRSKFD